MSKAKTATKANDVEKPEGESAPCSSHCSTPDRVKPIIVLETGMMSEDDMNRLRDNGICVVESETPDMVRFIDPPVTGYDKMELAAIELFRRCMSQSGWQLQRKSMSEQWATILMDGEKMAKLPSVPKVEGA